MREADRGGLAHPGQGASVVCLELLLEVRRQKVVHELELSDQVVGLVLRLGDKQAGDVLVKVRQPQRESAGKRGDAQLPGLEVDVQPILEPLLQQLELERPEPVARRCRCSRP